MLNSVACLDFPSSQLTHYLNKKWCWWISVECNTQHVATWHMRPISLPRSERGTIVRRTCPCFACVRVRRAGRLDVSLISQLALLDVSLTANAAGCTLQSSTTFPVCVATFVRLRALASPRRSSSKDTLSLSLPLSLFGFPSVHQLCRIWRRDPSGARRSHVGNFACRVRRVSVVRLPPTNWITE